MSTLARLARAEWGALYLAVRGAWVARRWWAVPMTLGAVCLTGVIQPVWGALTQILIVFGIAEMCLGATLAGTLYARVGIALGPDHPIGLPASDARVVDTGPSAAVVGLAVFLGWRYGAYVTAGVVIVAMVVEVVLKENLAGKEHLAAIVAVLVLCGGSAVRQRRSRARDGSTSGAPPIQS